MKKNKIRKIIVILLLVFGSILITTGLLFHYYTGSVSKSNKQVTVSIKGSGSQIAQELKANNLIKSVDFFKLYLKINRINDLKAGVYEIRTNMNLLEIISLLQKGNNYNEDEITITFKEGINMSQIATIIANNTLNSNDDVMNLLKDKTYLQTLIDQYWFLDKDILNKEIYYPLEGYLFPETYRFINKNVSVKDIFAKMLQQMEKELNEYKSIIQDSEYSIHEILTLASIIEKEGKENDFKNISSVFHNRLAKGKKLESCATTYYGMGLDFNDTGIANSEMIANINPYNTYKISALPVGPIAMPSRKAIEASLNPNKTEYLYFLSDSSHKSYFFKTYKEHQLKQKELQKEGKWYR